MNAVADKMYDRSGIYAIDCGGKLYMNGLAKPCNSDPLHNIITQ